MKADQIRTAVRERYGGIAAQTADATQEAGCCGPSCCGDEVGAFDPEAQAAKLGYAAEDLQALPEGANMGLGCGNPTALAGLKPGEAVLDLGSGGGLDCFLASKQVGAEGRVIGVDMTPDMVELARRNATKGGYDNVEFRLGEIEALPVADSSIDVILSNCVINLSAHKDRVFEEAFRVLKPGGRLMISDLICDQPVPEALLDSPDAVTSCLPVERSDYLGQLRNAGFSGVEVEDEARFGTDHLAETSEIGQMLLANGADLEGVRAFAQGVRSAHIAAVKPT